MFSYAAYNLYAIKVYAVIKKYVFPLNNVFFEPARYINLLNEWDRDENDRSECSNIYPVG